MRRSLGLGSLGVIDVAAFGVFELTAVPLSGNRPAASRCLSVSSVVLTGIANGLTVDGGGTLRGAQAVRSEDFADTWLVAADIEGPGLDGPDQIAVWSTTGITAERPRIPVPANTLGDEFSVWGRGGSRGFSGD